LHDNFVITVLYTILSTILCSSVHTVHYYSLQLRTAVTSSGRARGTQGVYTVAFVRPFSHPRMYHSL